MSLFRVASGCLAVLLASPGFDRRQLWNVRNLRERVPLALMPFAVAAPALALAGPYEDGLAAYEKGEYDKALELYTKAADEGVVDAHALGPAVLSGACLPLDPEPAGQRDGGDVAAGGR